jgi:putative tryptophan/tyrosine transport system substrate-binding protein
MAACGTRAAILEWDSYGWRSLARRQCRGRRCLSERFSESVNDLGYVEGKNIHLDHRFPAENPDRFRTLARELVDEKPDVIIDVLVRGAVELKKLTDTIPIVFVIVADPVGYGLVKSLARPDSNATGLSLMTTDLSAKRLEILKEAVPKLSQVALLLDPTG